MGKAVLRMNADRDLEDAFLVAGVAPNDDKSGGSRRNLQCVGDRIGNPIGNRSSLTSVTFSPNRSSTNR